MLCDDGQELITAAFGAKNSYGVFGTKFYFDQHFDLVYRMNVYIIYLKFKKKKNTHTDIVQIIIIYVSCANYVLLQRVETSAIFFAHFRTERIQKILEKADVSLPGGTTEICSPHQRV